MARKKRWDGTRFIIFLICGSIIGGSLGSRWATRESIQHPNSASALVFPVAVYGVIGGLLAGFLGERSWYWIVGRYEDESSFLEEESWTAQDLRRDMVLIGGLDEEVTQRILDQEGI